MIDEELAKRANDLHRWSEYKEGSCTKECDDTSTQFIKAVDELKEQYKDNLDEKKLEKIRYYSSKYFEALANAYNTYNKIEASYPSWAIVGREGFNTKKQEKQMEQLSSFYEKNGDLFNPTGNHYFYKIKGICQNTAIYSNDDDAIEKIENKIKEMEENQQMMKNVNAYYRKNKKIEECKDFENYLNKFDSDEKKARTIQNIKFVLNETGIPFPTYHLQNKNAEIRRLKNRLEDLKRLKQKTEENKKEEYPEVEGVTVEEDTEDMRIRLIFDSKPNEEVRNELKMYGFRWSWSNEAWQRQLTDSGIYYTKRVLEKIKELLK